jgi:hypothetical protein
MTLPSSVPRVRALAEVVALVNRSPRPCRSGPDRLTAWPCSQSLLMMRSCEQSSYSARGRAARQPASVPGSPPSWTGPGPAVPPAYGTAARRLVGPRGALLAFGTSETHRGHLVDAIGHAGHARDERGQGPPGPLVPARGTEVDAVRQLGAVGVSRRCSQLGKVQPIRQDVKCLLYRQWEPC